jgi:hypothetical protein
VSTLRNSEQLALRDELRIRLRLATAVLKEFAHDEGIEVDALQPHVVSTVLTACYRGVGFAAEEVRGMRRTAPRSGRKAGDANEDEE